MATRAADPLAKELDGIKRLLILQLLTSGVQATDVALALGVDKSVVSRLVPSRGIKKKEPRAETQNDVNPVLSRARTGGGKGKKPGRKKGRR